MQKKLTINPKVQKFIDSIPENGTVGVTRNSFGDQNYKKAVGKINGRIEFFEYEDDEYSKENGEPAFTTIATWYYNISPEDEKEYFDIKNMPRKTGKVFTGTFIWGNKNERIWKGNFTYPKST